MRKAKKRTTGPGRPHQLELPLPMDPRQAFREEIERSQTVPRQARVPKPRPPIACDSGGKSRWQISESRCKCVGRTRV